MRFLVLKSKLFDKGEILNEKVDCDNCSKYRGEASVLLLTRATTSTIRIKLGFNQLL